MKKILLLTILVLQTIITYSQQTTPGGFLIIPPEDARRIPMPRNTGMFALDIKTAQINTKITGQAATTTIDQVFYNPTTHQLQGYYFFPIPKNASIDKFSMYINGKETQGEVLDADKAKKIYEDIVRKSLDPALLEYYNHGLFRVRIFPIRPKSDQRVKLTYTQTLSKENGTVEYQFPVGSRKNEKQKVPQVSFKIEVNATEKIKNIYVPTHEVEVVRKGDNQAVVGFESKAINTNNYFKLYYTTTESKFGMSMLNYTEKDEDKGYFFLNVSPGLTKKEEVVHKDITFVLDASGSMAGDKMDQAKKALQFCIANLNDKDRFNIVRFSTEATSLFDGVEAANAANRKKAKAYINDLRPIGGTNIDEALEMALAAKTKEARPYFVVFMTDGKPTIGETGEEALLKKVKERNTKGTRIFTFGIGTNLNTHLLDKLTVMTKAYRTYVLPNEDIEIKVSDFYTKVSSPILTDVKITFDKNVRVSEIQPKQLEDLFEGSTLTLLGRYKGNGTSKVTLEGMVNGKKQTFTYNVDFKKKAEQHEFIASLWAARTVGYLLDQIRLQGENKEVIDEVVRLAKKHGIITPYTSYLILEDEAVSMNTNRIRRDQQLLRGRVTQDDQFVKDRNVAYESMKKQAGTESVKASKEAQTLNSVEIAAAKPAVDEELDYKTTTGATKNLASDIVNVQGRAFYNNNNVWTDSYVQLKNKQKVNRIQFNSSEYFALAKKDKRVVDFYALGRNVRFVLDETVYEVYE